MNSIINNNSIILPLILQKKILYYCWLCFYQLKWKLSLLLVNHSWFNMLASIENHYPRLAISMYSRNIEDYQLHINNRLCIAHYSKICISLVGSESLPTISTTLLSSSKSIRLCLYEYTHFEEISKSMITLNEQLKETKQQAQDIQDTDQQQQQQLCKIELEIDNILNIDSFVGLLSLVPPLSSLTLLTDHKDNIDNNYNSGAIIRCIRMHHAVGLRSISLDLKRVTVETRNEVTDTIATYCMQLNEFAINIENQGDNQLAGLTISNVIQVPFSSSPSSKNYNNNNIVNHRLNRLRFYVDTDSHLSITKNPFLLFPMLTRLYLWNINSLENTIDIIREKASVDPSNQYRLEWLQSFIGPTTFGKLDGLLGAIAQSRLTRVGIMVFIDPKSVIDRLTRQLINKQNTTLVKFKFYRPGVSCVIPPNKIFQEIQQTETLIKCKRYIN
ncbi:hypothetical protein PPL_01923 [Heterostelium album PN500]|uniref:Uncharacterized protein n=1 Tax=Heterostelium pallidum (strain ATCC 26659 / Pp 5 / PN500) TaxID=670386 RepID=D3B0V6_HETP5|nr:hypothetical protein PPL_01923 [Heterostelium album PN500]EFA84930.1 hypothetical protein PPL_01923 [Heterostelium album PN500]|eukprot:XP_020437040.1 hypothetical protein PPL_01923 [Heterostelium album PN500]